MSNQVTIEQMQDILTKVNPDVEIMQGVGGLSTYIADPSNITLILSDDIGDTVTAQELFKMLNDIVGKTIKDHNLMNRYISKDCKLYVSYKNHYGRSVTGLSLTKDGVKLNTEMDTYS
jgi:hypothetical protein